MELQCEEGTQINIVRANYGRFSNTICNAKEVPGWSVNCFQPKTLRIVKER